MPNYQTSKIYKIWSPSHPDDIYIGSTIQSLSKRMVGHRTKYKQYKNGKNNYITSFKILEYGDAKIELIEDFKCQRREELTAREGYYIRTLDCINKNVAGRTMKGWYEDNKTTVLERHKQYREDNKEKIAQYQKQYKEDNKEKLAQKDKQYQQKNKEKIKAYNSEKITCECGTVLTRGCISRHKKSNKHLQALKATKHFTA